MSFENVRFSSWAWFVAVITRMSRPLRPNPLILLGYMRRMFLPSRRAFAERSEADQLSHERELHRAQRYQRSGGRHP